MNSELADLLEMGRDNSHIWVSHWVVQLFSQSTFLGHAEAMEMFGLSFARRKSKHGGKHSFRGHIILLFRTGGEEVRRGVE